MNDSGEVGEDRLWDRLETHYDMPAGDQLQCLFEAFRRFTDHAPQHDDVTALVLRYVGGRISLAVTLCQRQSCMHHTYSLLLQRLASASHGITLDTPKPLLQSLASRILVPEYELELLVHKKQ